jgi:hypothetical protein
MPVLLRRGRLRATSETRRHTRFHPSSFPKALWGPRSGRLRRLWGVARMLLYVVAVVTKETSR